MIPCLLDCAEAGLIALGDVRLKRKTIDVPTVERGIRTFWDYDLAEARL